MTPNCKVLPLIFIFKKANFLKKIFLRCSIHCTRKLPDGLSCEISNRNRVREKDVQTESVGGLAENDGDLLVS